MKITRLKTRLVNVPLDKPVGTAIHSIQSVGSVLLSLETDEGLVGESYVFTINAVRLKAFDEMIRSFAHQVIGRDPHFVSAIWEDIWREINPGGHKGLTISALSAIDTACWDLIGKAAEQPLYKLFGACRDRIDTYASGGLWLSQSIDELLTDAEQFIQQGFRAMKIRVGSDSAATDVERVRLLREAVGPDIGLMADANQALGVKQAIRLGRRLQEFDLIWLEEPVAAYDLEGHAQVRLALEMDLASGETEYTRLGMQQMIAHRACDILMPDLQRIGGLSEMRRAAALASAHNLPISTHIFTEQSLSIAGSVPNCISVEHMPWHVTIFNEPMKIRGGQILMSDQDGLGFTFNPESIERYAIDS